MVPDILRLFADVAFMQWESHNRFVPIENGQRTDDAFASLEDDTIRRDLLRRHWKTQPTCAKIGL
jgi:hypothetical protein